MPRQLQDRVAVVTGASNGIGRGIAETFAAEGAKTVLVARRAEVLDEVAAGIRSRGGEALPVPTDLTREGDVVALFDTVRKRYGRLDVLVNNAGVATHINTEDITLDYWREVLDINITAAFLCSREAVRIMKDQTPKGGRIINMGSVSAKTPRPDSLPLHHDQVRHPGHDPSTDHGRAQAQHRRLHHSSRRHAQLVHDPPRPEQGGAGPDARRLRHGRRGRGQGRAADGRAAAGGEPVRGDDPAQPHAVVHREGVTSLRSRLYRVRPQCNPAADAMNPEHVKVRISDEFDDDLRAAVRAALAELGAELGHSSWGMGGSQEIETLEVMIGDQRVIVEAETYVGLTVSGDRQVIERLIERVRAIVARMSAATSGSKNAT